MADAKKGRLPAALYVDREAKWLVRIRPHLNPFHLHFDHAFSLEQAQDLAGRRLFCLCLIRFDAGTEEQIPGFCAAFRTRSPHGVVVILTDAPDSATEERLFDYGANDVVNMEQSSPGGLAKRIQVHLCAAGVLQACPKRVRLGDTLVDFDRREVRRECAVHHLPGILADLLQYFIENADHVVSREELQRSPIWLDSVCTPAQHGGKTFDVNISKLRKIIEPDPQKPRIIVSVRGVGWKLASDALPEGSECVRQSP
jgi:two-component system alkaline phosphatase synthesis response regulator PhoP